MNNMNMNNMNGYTNTTRTLAGIAPSPFIDVAENIRLRQLMLQQSAAFEGGGGGGIGEAPSNTMGMIQNNMTGGGRGGGETPNSGMLNGIRAASIAAPGIGGLGDFGNNGITANANAIANVHGGGSSNNNGVSGDSNMLQINKRQKL